MRAISKAQLKVAMMGEDGRHEFSDKEYQNMMYRLESAVSDKYAKHALFDLFVETAGSTYKGESLRTLMRERVKALEAHVRVARRARAMRKVHARYNNEN